MGKNHHGILGSKALSIHFHTTEQNHPCGALGKRARSIIVIIIV
jgi:hypothetical protein